MARSKNGPVERCAACGGTGIGVHPNPLIRGDDREFEMCGECGGKGIAEPERPVARRVNWGDV